MCEWWLPLNRDLKAAVAAGSFRQDFFYRLNVFPIQIPSLRERIDDIPLLVEYLIERYAKKAGKRIRQIRKQTLELFQAYDWPGNIRELQNVIERAVVLCDGETFSVDKTWLKGERDRQAGPAVPLAASIAEREREIIEAALAQSRGRISGPPAQQRNWECHGRRWNRRSRVWESTNIFHKSIHLTPFIASGLASFRFSPLSPPPHAIGPN